MIYSCTDVFIASEDGVLPAGRARARARGQVEEALESNN